MENITYQETIRRANLLYKYRGAYENAKDYLYYGYSFNAWFDHHKFLGIEDAKIIWNEAIKFLSKD